jgi:hypothetical protein
VRAARPDPSLVSLAEPSGGPGAPPAGPRLVGLPALRRGPRDDHPGPAPSRDLRLLCCEGPCSPGLQRVNHAQLKAAGISDDSRRGIESSYLTHTAHYFVRLRLEVGTTYQVWACVKCGTERTYGAEE